MTDLSDNVQSAITATLQSASIHLDYVGDLQQGYYRGANQETKTSGTNNTLDKTKKQHQHQNDTSALASTATGIPDPTAVTTAIDRVEGNEKKEQIADDEPGVASTATGLPASEPVINAMKEAGDDSIQDDSTNENNVQKTTSTPATASRNVIDNMAPYDSQDGPSPDPSTMKHQQQQTQNQQNQQQQQPEKSCNQIEPSQSSGNANLSGDADQGDQNDNVSGVKTSAGNIDSNSATMQAPTHTIIEDNVKSVDPTPVEPMVENIVTNIQSVEEPVVEERLIREPPPTATAATDEITTTNSTCTTSADVKAEEDLPNVETRAFVSKPITEHTDPAGQMVVTEDPTSDEIKVEQVFRSPAAAAATTTTTPSSSMDNTNIKQIAVADIKPEDMPVVEEPAITEDIKTAKSINKKGDERKDIATDEPIKKDDGTVNINDLNVEQGSVERQLVDAKEDNTTLASSSTDDRTEPHVSSASDKTEAESNKPQQQQQQQYEQTSIPSRSIESKSLSPQSSTQQQGQATTTTSIDQTQEQPTAPEPDASKSSKCIIM